MPEEVKISVSTDGRTFIHVGTVFRDFPATVGGLYFKTYGLICDKTCRYVRFQAVRPQIDGAWLFTDEILINWKWRPNCGRITSTIVEKWDINPYICKWFTNIGYDKETIKTVEIQKLSNSKEEDYKIITNSNLEVLVDINKGKVNSFFDNNNYTVNQTSLDEDEAKTVLLEKYDVLKGENDYELVSFEKESNDVWTGYFNKKYGELYNKYQGITLKIIPELDKIVTVAYFDEEFEDTEIIVSKEDAINIAKNKIEVNNIESINAYLSIEKSNLFVETLEDINFDEENLEDTNYIVRKVWRVDIKQNNNLNILSFFVDVETGEIIGGDGIR